MVEDNKLNEQASLNVAVDELKRGAENTEHDSELSVKKLKLKFFTVFIFLMAVLVSLIFTLAYSLIKMEDGKFFRKDLIQKDLKLIVSNGGGLDIIKHAFLVFPLANQFSVLITSSDEYYTPRTPLSLILNDLRLEAFRTGDKEILPVLESLISEYEEVNPFDSLPAGQKDRFENVRVKSGEEYLKISNDVNGIAEELRQKNLLVGDYLSDSKMSYWISIFAVLLSFGIGAYQIFSARPESTKRLLLDVLSERDRDRDRNKKTT